MNRIAIESKFVSNEALFELKRASELQIPKELCLYLKAQEFPWKALGKALTRFIEECVEQIKKEERMKGKISKNAYLEKASSIVVCENAVIEAGAYIAGPAFIGPGATVRHGAYIRGSVYLATGSLVGHTTECKGALFLPLAKAAHFNYVGDSILGYDCNLGAGTKLANLKINQTSITVSLYNKKIDTGLKKFGAILGNRSQTGCNSVTNPGTIMLPESVLLPNHTALGILRN
jgi:NDP-sugar pyrophosphorylase family protein